ncbi:hypothetical protein [Ideonella sp. A 288]|uniref:hypothetical protein n=1 Tax=Ideonella sp. A 288 TaxID=1962181 RepID=UPI000B4A8916|nr:hypothetical protein [Ideonella sp. A 288]
MFDFMKQKAAPQAVDVEAVLKGEFQYLAGPLWVDDASRPLGEVFARIHALPAEQRPSALCLSGGGIRSATFSLGVLQSLARSGRLAGFHYLSTVSGGGYIGSWLSNWLRVEKWNWEKVRRKLADGTAQPPPAAPPPPPAPGGATESAEDSAAEPRAQDADASAHDPVTRLRAYSNFLSPVIGLSSDSLSLAAIFLRNLLLNWLVWVPLLAAAVAAPRFYLALLSSPPESPLAPVIALTALSAALIVAGIAYVVADLPGKLPDESSANAFDDVKSWFAFACFAPVTVAAVTFSIVGAWAATFRDIAWHWFTLAGIGAHLAGIGVGLFWRHRRKLPLRQGGRNWFGFGMVLASGGAGGLLLWLALQHTGLPADAADDRRLLYAAVAVPAMLGAFWLAMTLYAGLAGRVTDEDDREWWARATAWWLYASLAWMVAFAIVIYLPLLLLDNFAASLPTGAQIGVGGGLLGVLTSAIGYWSKNGADLKKRADGLLQKSGLRVLDIMALLVVLAAVVGLNLGWSAALEHCHRWMPKVCEADLRAESDYLRSESMLAALPVAKPAGVAATPAAEPAAAALRGNESRAYEHVLLNADWRAVLLAIVLLALVGAGMSRLIGANTFSLHGMYGNRLVRAYLGAARARRHPHWFTGFDPEDNCRLAECSGPWCGDHPPRLFHVVNMALNLVRPSNRRLAWQQRKAASFIATPRHCGAAGIGFVPTEAYAGAQGMSLGRALTISGAAASPNMGYHSSALVTLVMAIFNVRLGWWLPNPGPAGAQRWSEDGPRTGLSAMLDEALGRTTDDRDSVYLSDGGHFENLGVYEMVRRRCHRIVVVDATCDGEFQYTDLLDAVRKIRVDLGIPVDLPPLLPGPDRRTKHARRIVARIRYSACDGNPPDSDGVLILLKPRLLPEDPPDVSQYADSSRRVGSAFPHQSTADQFFDESQFESYRVLGMVTAEAAFPGAPEQWPDLDPMSLEPTTAGSVDGKCACKFPVGAAGVGAVGGLGEVIHNFGTGAALVAALTVGGTLGVAGTVALAPGEVSLSSTDRALLKDGLSIRLAAPDLRLTEGDRALLSGLGGGVPVGPDWRGPTLALENAAARLSEAASALQGSGSGTRGGGSVAGGAGGPGSPGGTGGTGGSGGSGQTGGTGGPGGPTTASDQRLTWAVEGLTVALQDMGRKLPTAGNLPGPGLESGMNRLNLQVESLAQALASAHTDGRGSSAAMSAILSDIRQALADLKVAVETAGPRRNVRGLDGGSR